MIDVDALIKDIQHEFSVPNRPNRWAHTWAIARLLYAGEREGFDAIPEYEVALPSMRSGLAYCDVVWVDPDGEPAYAFEVGFSHGKPRELAKLAVLRAQGADTYLVQLGRHGIKKASTRKAKALL